LFRRSDIETYKIARKKTTQPLIEGCYSIIATKNLLGKTQRLNVIPSFIDGIKKMKINKEEKSMEDDLVLRVRDLSVELGGETVIDNLSFELKKGDTVTILGPNGAGKTVLLKTLLGLLPYKGEIKWEKNITIGYVPQRLPFIKDIPLSVKDFLKLKSSSEKEIAATLNSVGFKQNFLDKKTGELSSGQFQRLLIAWSLIQNPQVLLFDEPTTGIDIEGEETIYRLLARLKKDRELTILLVTHDLSVVYTFSNYVVCLNKQPVCYGRPREILTPENLKSLYGEEVKFYRHKH
jgi:zinc transport system ATP-binding protein